MFKMTYTKKLYKQIADILRKLTYTQANDGFKYLSKNELIDELCKIFKLDNQRFDTDRFIEATE